MTINQFLDTFYHLPRRAKKLAALSWDTLSMVAAYLLANSLRRGELWLSFPLRTRQWLALAVAIAVALAILSTQGLYRSVIRYSGTRLLHIIFNGVTVSAVVLALLLKLSGVSAITIAVIYWGFTVLALSMPRVLIRIQQDSAASRGKENVVIYGAGSAGRQLANALRVNDHYHPQAFIDDSPQYAGQLIQGLAVYSPGQLPRLLRETGCRKVLLAIGRISHARRAEILDLLEALQVEVLSIPEFSDIVSGRARIEDLREVAIAEILGRDPVAPDPALLLPRIQGKVVMVTGAGGSIGSELCRQIARLQPKALILFEQSEFALYSVEQELTRQRETLKQDWRLAAYLGSVQDQDKLCRVMRAEAVETVFHAAAYKHVPMVEYNVAEGVKNNVFGTWHAALAAQQCGVGCFVLISTDKAVRPTNTMGATKRMAELCLQALARQHPQTCYCMVRFGNVLGSSGSVVPLFHEQIRQGGPITVTHPDIIRYFMTIPEAAELVIQASSMAEGGEVFVLDMGEPVRILDLARRMIHLSGRAVCDAQHPDGDIEIQFSGLRPGEKLFEELLVGENTSKTGHPRILCAKEKEMDYTILQQHLQAMHEACAQHDAVALRQLLQSAATDFNPVTAICDLLLPRHDSAP